MASVMDSGCSMELNGWNSSVSVRPSIPCNQSVVKAAPYSPEATAVFATAITLMVVFTIVGNIMVIIAVLTSRSLQSPQNLFLVSLAAADILVATLIIPFSLANELLGYWYFKSLWCEIYLALDVLFCTSSIVHLCAISLDRYLSISRVTYGRQRTSKHIKAAIIVVWLISAIISFPPLLSLNKSEVGPEERERGPQCQLNDERWYILYSTIGSFFAPCLIMILVYVRIYQIAKQRTRCPPGEPRKDGAGSATPIQPQRNIHANRNGDSTSPSQEKTSNARPPTLAITPSPSLKRDKQSPSCDDPTPNNLLQPPSPAPTPNSPTASPHGPSPTSVSPSAPAAPPQLCPAQTKAEGKKNKRAAGRKADNNNGDSSSNESDIEHSHREGSVSTSTAGSPAGGGIHSPASAHRYRDMLATSKGTQLVPEGKSQPDNTPGAARRKAMVNREKRFTFVLAVVIGVFVVCWFPFFFSYSLQAVCPDTCTIPDPLFTFFFWIGYCNSCLNPVIYTIFNKDFRKAFKKILCSNTKGTFY